MTRAARRVDLAAVGRVAVAVAEGRSAHEAAGSARAGRRCVRSRGARGTARAAVPRAHGRVDLAAIDRRPVAVSERARTRESARARGARRCRIGAGGARCATRAAVRGRTGRIRLAAGRCAAVTVAPTDRARESARARGAPNRGIAARGAYVAARAAVRRARAQVALAPVGRARIAVGEPSVARESARAGGADGAGVRPRRARAPARRAIGGVRAEVRLAAVEVAAVAVSKPSVTRDRAERRAADGRRVRACGA